VLAVPSLSGARPFIAAEVDRGGAGCEAQKGVPLV
jgi:hypothetical protein